MTEVKTGDQVMIDYVVKTGDGRVVGSTEANGPQAVTVGGGEIFPSVEKELLGKTEGEAFAVNVPSEDAFGPRREEMVVQIPREQLGGLDRAPEPGMQLSARGQGGETIVLTVIDVAEQHVTADGNHPLAGEDLNVDVTVREIRPAA